MKMEKRKYLDRINYSGDLNPSLSTLRKLQKTHLLHVPFENLDIHYQKPIILNIDNIYKKIVQNNRGGFCYELNALFYELLLSLGYKAKRVSARVFKKGEEYGPEFDHLAIIVKIENQEYLTDVGFGEFTFGPLVLQTKKTQKDERGIFSIKEHNNQYLQVNKEEKNKWIPQYIFQNKECELDEFNEMCIYHQTNSNSHFTHKRLISKPIENGRITISGNVLKLRALDAVDERNLMSETEFVKELKHYFNIRLYSNFDKI